MTLEEIQKLNIHPDQDAYMSIYSYTQKHKELFDKTGTLAGIKDVTTNTLVFDFDSKTDLEKARLDAVTLCSRLVDTYNVALEDIACYLSGNKGFHIVVSLAKEITVEQFKQAVGKISQGLETFDTQVFDPQRILRLEYTKHPVSGLYKIPLSVYELDEMSVDEIRNLAKTPREDYEHHTKTVQLPESLFVVKEKKKTAQVETEEFDYNSPAKGWKIYKWALAQGWFEENERHKALMVVAATCRGLGYDRATAYYICKSALKKQSQRTGQPEFDKSELYENIIDKSVYSPNWQGGQYSPASDPWLKEYCERMGFDTAEKEESPVMDLDLLINQFIGYSTNFEQNVIKLGIADLDEHIIFSTSTLNGILGQPGAGKTTVAIEYLKNSSFNGVPSMFFSLDMGPPLVFSKLVQKETGADFKDVMKMYREDVIRREQTSAIIKDKYKNVGFNFRCGVTVANIRDAISSQEERTGIKPKLIVIDYLENLAGPYSDPTANAAIITNQLKDMATELEVCVVLLLQTQKHSTPDVSDPLLSMKQIKGSSAIEQNCSTVLTLWREGYNPNNIEEDNYISFAIVKNRFGPLGRWDYSWDPVKGHIRSMTEEEQSEFSDFKKRKKEQKMAEASEKSKWE